MNARNTLMLIAAALTTTALIVPTSGLSAQDRTIVIHDRQPQVFGNGQMVTQRRPIGDFRRISLGGSGDLTVRVGPAPSLTVTAESNILPLLGSRVVGDELELEPTHSYSTRVSPRYTITVPDLRALQIAGSGDARIDGIANRSIDLTIAGSGNVVAKGRTADLKVTVAGSGDVDTLGLRTGRAKVTIAGSGDVKLATNGPLDADIVGSGNVIYFGAPSSVSFNRMGSGRIVRLR